MGRNRLYPPSVKPGIPRLAPTPRGWRLVRFGDLLEPVERPATVEDAQVYQLVVAKRNRGGIEARERLLGAQIKTKTQFFTREGDFLISRRQIIHGACGIVPQHLDGALVSNEYSTLVPREDCDLSFIEFFSHSLYFQQTCFHASVGVDVEKMIFRIEGWMREPVTIPPLAEQRRIVEILSTWGAAIEQTEKLVAAKERMKRGLMRRLLSKEKGWREYRLDAVADIRFSTVDKVSREGHLPVRLCNYMDVYANRRITSAIPFMESTASPNEIERFLLQVGDVLITKDSETPDDIGVPAVVAEELENVVCGYHLGIIRADRERVVSSFLAFEFTTRRVRQQLWSRANGATRYGLTLDGIGGLRVTLPSVREQKRIAEILNAADAELLGLRERAAALRRQKQGLMQVLLTGKLRVTVERTI